MEVTTLDKIKKISLRLFNEKGYEGTSLKDIFNEIGISAPSFYYYYASKKDLYVELMKTSQEDSEKYVLERMEKFKQASAGERLYALLESFVDYSIEKKEEAMFIFRALLFPNHEFRLELEEQSRKWRDVYQEQARLIIEEGQKNGTFLSEIDPDVILSSFFHLVIGMVCNIESWVMLEKSEDIKPYFDIFYKGIVAA